jgi:hypothetical protein
MTSNIHRYQRIQQEPRDEVKLWGSEFSTVLMIHTSIAVNDDEKHNHLRTDSATAKPGIHIRHNRAGHNKQDEELLWGNEFPIVRCT